MAEGQTPLIDDHNYTHTVAFVLQHFSDYGTSTPVVARTALQARDIFNACNVSEELREQALKFLFDVQQQLVRCVEIRDKLTAEIESGRDTFKPDVRTGTAIRAPGIADLQGRAETFLQAAKFALRDTGFAVGTFFAKDSQKVADFGHQFHKFEAWCRERFGDADRLTLTLVSVQLFAAQVLNLRNAVDHPRDEPGKRLVIRNFFVHQTAVGVMLHDPAWGLLGEPLSAMAPSMSTIIDGILEVQEDLIAAIFERFKAWPGLMLQEIPEAQRDSANPIRLKVGMLGCA